MRSVFRDLKKKRYHARVYRHRALMPQIIEDIETMIYALLKSDESIEFKEIDEEEPGFPYAPRLKWSAHINEWFARGRTREQAMINLLGAIYGDGCWFPKT